MIFRRCQCGKSEHYDSGMPPAACQGCEECGTTYAQHPDDHKPREPHNWEQRFNARTGQADRRMCQRCYTTERVK